MKNLTLYLILLLSLSCKREEPTPQALDGYPYYEQASAYLAEGKRDSAFLAFGKAKEIFTDNKDSLNVANCFIRMAIMLTNEGDYYGGQETALGALDYLNLGNPDHHVYLSANYNNIGRASYRLQDFKNALKFYDLALQFCHDSLTAYVYLNNKARVYQQNKDYQQALAIYRRLLDRTAKNKLDYARTLTNVAVTRSSQDADYDPGPALLEALSIREDEEDLEGMNASYAHLADYYASRNDDSATFFAGKRYQLAKRLRFGDEQVNALQQLISLSPPDSIKYYFEIYRRLNDSLQLSRAAAKNQFALIRYEVEKNRTDNLRLQKENAEKAHQVTRHRVWTGAAVAFAIVIVGSGTFWYRKRAQRLALEAQNRIKAHQLRTSRKIHDVVANGLYRVMAEIENKTDIDRERVLDRLESMYERSRDISYDQDETDTVSRTYHEQLSELLKSFATESVKVVIAGNDAESWSGVGPDIKREIRHILQELLVNMRKHSEASNVAVRFERERNRFRIYYSDNGKGLPEALQRGNGFVNTGNRIESLGGTISFTSEAGKGLKIAISFPVS